MPTPTTPRPHLLHMQNLCAGIVQCLGAVRLLHPRCGMCGECGALLPRQAGYG